MKKGNEKSIIIILSVFVVFLIVTFIIAYFVISSNKNTVTEKTTTIASILENPTFEKKTENTTQSAIESTDEKTTVTETQNTVTQPEKLTAGLEKAGLSYDALGKSTQLIYVYKEYGSYNLCCFEKENGLWAQCRENKRAYVGLNGTVEAANKTEGDKKTPLGLYTLGFAFGTHGSIDTGLEYRQITNDVYWVDDVNSVHYNKWADTSKVEKDWNHAERMIEYTSSYEYGITIDFNTAPIVKGKGSAIFVHCGDYSTLGCVAVNKDELRNILSWLRKDSEARILIVE